MGLPVKGRLSSGFTGSTVISPIGKNIFGMIQNKDFYTSFEQEV